MKKLFSGDIITLGSFELTTPVMRVSDPCYDRNVWCCGTVDNCKVGTWEAAVLRKDLVDWGSRNMVLAVRFMNGGPTFSAINRAVCNATGAWHECQFEVGVDSGQAGFFDEAHYREPHPLDKFGQHPMSGETWYMTCCDATRPVPGAGTIPYGAVAESGFGDGGYTAFEHVDQKGQVDFLLIVFINEEDLDPADSDK